MGSKLIDAAMDLVKRYLKYKINASYNFVTTPVKLSQKINYERRDANMTKSIERFPLVQDSVAACSALSADDFVVWLIRLNKESAEKEDFINAKKLEVDELKKRDI